MKLSSSVDHSVDAALEAFGRVLLDDDEVQIRWIDLRVPEARTVETVSAPSLTCSVFFRGSGYRGFAGCPPVPFRPGSFCLGYAASPVKGFGYVAPGESLQFLLVKFPAGVLSRLGMQDLRQPSGALVETFDAGGQVARVTQIPTPPAVERCAREMLDTSASTATGRALLRAKAWEMLALGLEQLDALLRPSPPASLSRADIRRVRDARALLYEQPARSWTVAALARAVGLNEKKLKQGYRYLFSTSVYRSLQERRLELSARMLEDGNEPVADVAAACGFHSASHLSRYFKARFGMSPAAYRRRARG